MVTVSESALEAFLATPRAYGLGKQVPVTLIETHISKVFLAGERAYKLKKSVDFGYLDFTSVEKRHDACFHELQLNRRTAPELYLSVIPIRQAGSGFVLGSGEGAIVDWLLEMVRFEQSDVLAFKAHEGSLTVEEVGALVRFLAEFHRAAEVRPEAGGQARFAQVLKSNEENYAPYIGSIYDADEIQQLNEEARRFVDTVGSLLDARRAEGWIRHCHGDLHLGNVALIEGVPVPFDCIEFNDDFARIDILYDLAFLLMDLSFRAKENPSLHGFSNVALNAYLQASPISEWLPHVRGLAAMPLFMSCRAGVRSHVNARTWENLETQEEKQIVSLHATSYARYAHELLQATPPILYAVGGLSGTGKSTLAKALAPLLGGPNGALHLRSDVLRKKLAGAEVSERLPSSAYTQAASDAVYAELMHLADAALAAGQSVICDAVFAKPEERTNIEAVAHNAGVPFEGIWLSAPRAELENRVERRERTEKDASDASVAVVHQQLNYELGSITWAEVNSAGSPAAVLARCKAALKLTSP